MIKNDTETREEILAGAKKLYEAVKTTMGPKGRNVLVKDKFGTFSITHDGVTVARSIKTKDNPEGTLGIDLLKEASNKMDQVGDGTTTVTVLAYHLMVEANKLIADGANPMQVKKELDAAVDQLIEQVKKRSKTISKDHKEILQVATISAGEEKLGKIIADLMVEVGYDGAINVEASQGIDIETSVAEGYSFERGYLSQYFINDPNTRSVVLNKPAIIVVSGVVRELSDFQSLIDPLLEGGVKSFLIIADNVEHDALTNLVVNKSRGVFQAAAVKAPEFGDTRIQYLKDIAAYTGAEVIDSMTGNDLEAMTAEWVGTAEKVIVRENETVIIGGAGDEEAVEARILEMREQVKEADDVQTFHLQKRLAAITGSVGTIKVGAVTETQANEIRYRVDDALAAVKAAMKDGIVAGGGVTLRDIANGMEIRSKVDNAIFIALHTPLETLLDNSGVEYVNDLPEGQGVNVVTGKPVNMLEAGIIDPTKVTIEVIRNAFAVAGVALTVGGAVVDEPISSEELQRLMNA